MQMMMRWEDRRKVVSDDVKLYVSRLGSLLRSGNKGPLAGGLFLSFLPAIRERMEGGRRRKDVLLRKKKETFRFRSAEYGSL